MKKIVVGVVDVAQSQSAINWAMQFAKDYATSVELIHVVDTTWGHVPDDYLGSAVLKADAELREQAEAARGRLPGVPVTSQVLTGSPVNQLITCAEGASYFVIGSRPRGQRSGASRRAIRLVSLAPCSVIVIPSSGVPEGANLVVGVDGTYESDIAVQFAAELAYRHGEKLIVVHAWSHLDAFGVLDTGAEVSESTEADRRIVSEAIVGLTSRFPGLVIESSVSASRPERALSVAGAGARMLVVGSRSRHGLAHALLGSVSEAVVAELPCAVAVVRPMASAP